MLDIVYHAKIVQKLRMDTSVFLFLICF